MKRELQRARSSIESAFRSKLSFKSYNSRNDGNYQRRGDPKKDVQKKPAKDKREKGTTSSKFWCDIRKKSSHTTDRCWKKMTCNKCKRQGTLPNIVNPDITIGQILQKKEYRTEEFFY